MAPMKHHTFTPTDAWRLLREMIAEFAGLFKEADARMLTPRAMKRAHAPLIDLLCGMEALVARLIMLMARAILLPKELMLPKQMEKRAYTERTERLPPRLGAPRFKLGETRPDMSPAWRRGRATMILRGSQEFAWSRISARFAGLQLVVANPERYAQRLARRLRRDKYIAHRLARTPLAHNVKRGMLAPLVLDAHRALQHVIATVPYGVDLDTS